MKTVAIIKNTKQANKIKDLVDAFILPIKDYSTNYENTFTLQQIKKLKKLNKEIFISLNKNIHNNELEELKKQLKNIEKLKINGIIYYDISIIKLKQELNLKTDLIWSQEHMVTNYETINYWFEKGAKYAYLSSELTKQEIINISQNTKSKLFINVFGYIPMFTSKRHLVKNYLDTFNLKQTKKQKKLYKEEKQYPISDQKHGTTVYSNYILNILDENLTDIDYIVFNSNMIKDEDFEDTLKNYKNKTNQYKFPYEHGFLYKETIYKVKKNE